MIRLVLFDALHTIVTPRLPIFIQYSQSFEPFFGHLEPESIKSSFKLALKQVQIERPAYQSGAQDWWGEVIKRTALGAGADSAVVDRSLDELVPLLLKRFSSKEGYKLFEDAIPTLQMLKELNIRTGLVSNTDSRMLQALDDLDATRYFDPILISEQEGIEKPAAEIFRRACDRVRVERGETLHVGDELVADYNGASATGIKALLLRRSGVDGEGEHKEADEDLSSVHVVSSLREVVDLVKRQALRICEWSVLRL